MQCSSREHDSMLVEAISNLKPPTVPVHDRYLYLLRRTCNGVTLPSHPTRRPLVLTPDQGKLEDDGSMAFQHSQHSALSNQSNSNHPIPRGDMLTRFQSPPAVASLASRIINSTCLPLSSRIEKAKGILQSYYRIINQSSRRSIM